MIGEYICKLDTLNLDEKETLTIEGRYSYKEASEADKLSIELKYAT